MVNRRGLKLIITGLLAVVLAVGLAGPAMAQGAALERYIVVTAGSPVNGAVSRAAMENGGVTLQQFTTSSGLVVLIPEQALEKIQHVHGVVTAYADPIVSIVARPSKPPTTPAPEVLTWGVNKIDADLVWDHNGDIILDPGANTGLGVKVAVIDTGIDKTHPDLQANVKGGRNFVAKGIQVNPDAWVDDNGHGSHVAGIIAAVENDQGVIGVAPQASLYGVKVLSKTGSGYLSDVVSGIEWSIDPNGDGDQSDRMDVINLSLGSSGYNQELHNAVIAASNAGIVVVAAAGNANGGAVIYPAAFPEVIAVSATDSNNVIAGFISVGPEVDLAAPGVSIYSTYKGGGYATLSGTSMATPHVAGTAALVIASGVAADQVRMKLLSTADALGDPTLYGAGLVDAEEATTGVQTN